MSFAGRIEEDLIAALKSGDRMKLATLRLAKAAAQNAQIAKRAPLTDVEYQDVVRHQVKMRREAAVEYERGGRPDRARNERAEQAILEEYLPQQLDEADVRLAVERAIQQTGATGPRDLGKVMASAMQDLQGQAEGSRVSVLARALLTQQSS